MVTEDCWLLGCEAMFFGINLLFQSSMLPPSSGWKHTLKLKTAGSSVILASFCQSTWHCFPNDESYYMKFWRSIYLHLQKFVCYMQNGFSFPWISLLLKFYQHYLNRHGTIWKTKVSLVQKQEIYSSLQNVNVNCAMLKWFTYFNYSYVYTAFSILMRNVWWSFVSEI